MMFVYVVNQNGNPLMPCKPAKARKLLRDKKAKVVSRCPFTIQLLWNCEENTQSIRVGIDKGSHITGFCAVGNGQILISGEIHHRTDIKEKMDNRRANRRNRRNRKWYRPKRFNNRASSKRSGHLAFARVKGEPSAARPKDCQLLQRGQTIIWQKVV